jgi:mannitol operon repressor
MRDDDLKNLSRSLQELQSESDRGLALVGAAVIDDKLRETPGAFFVQGAEGSRLLEGGTAPLSTFSARTDACLALGLIDAFEHAEVSLLRKVRNEFAHGLHGTTFRSEPIRGYCSALRSNLPEGAGHPTDEPRFRFINAVVSLATRLYYRPEWVERERRTAKTMG